MWNAGDVRSSLLAMHPSHAPAVPLLAALALVSCGCTKDPGPGELSDSTTGAEDGSARDAEPSDLKIEKPKGPPKPVDPATLGAIRGVVRFDGAPPPRKPMDIDGVGGCKVHGDGQLTEDVIVEGGGLVNVLVHVRDGHQAWIAPAAAETSVGLDQLGCVYRPHVLAMRVGQTLLVKNSDDLSHNVNIRSTRNDPKNPSQAPGSLPVEWKPTRREIAAPFECNVHAWMKSWVCVLDHPWFAVSGSAGAFEIPGVPAGEYVLEAWHEKYGRKAAKVVVAAGASAEATFTFKGR